MLSRTALLVLAPAVLGAAFALPREGGDTARFPTGHTSAGLPRPEAVWAPYDADPDHALNRLFRLAYVATVQPDDVGAALPEESADSEPAGDWMLKWRGGRAGDTRTFGGDGRQLVREGFDEGEEAELLGLLAGIDDGVLPERPDLRVLLQWDLARLALRLEGTGENPVLVPALWRAVRDVALPPETLAQLEDPLHASGAAPEDSRAAAWAARVDERWVEVQRRSTRLFDPARTFLWSRVYLAHPEGRDSTLELLGAAARGDALEVPVGTRGLLVQGIVALDTEGRGHATPLVVDVRAQELVHRNGFAADDPTTTRDGVDFDLLQLEREGLRVAGRPAYRTVAPETQDLFRDYGTLKHTTYRAQCALCHRTTHGPEPELGGFPLLRKHAKPRPAEGEERLRAAEEAVAARVLGSTSGG